MIGLSARVGIGGFLISDVDLSFSAIFFINNITNLIIYVEVVFYIDDLFL
jgi:hypothetical protein